MNYRNALAELVAVEDFVVEGSGEVWQKNHAAFREREALAWANARAALVGEEPRPINTAPFEKPLLLWWKHAGWMRGRFVVEDSGKAGWRCDGDQVMPRNQADCTHWLPLPPAIAARNP